MATIPQIMQFEKNIEAIFIGILGNVCEFVYQSRQQDVNQSPRVTVKAIVGGIFDRQKLQIVSRPGWIYSTYSGQVELTIATNRTTEAKSDAHYELIGNVRALCQQYHVEAWQNQQIDGVFPILIFDVREDATADDVADTEDLDMTKLTLNILFSINPLALPTNT